ncbi:MAG: adenylyl-sulfate kinase [Planctomycetota bacterium]|nr:adenylyl-sulfate kinase [Planctomycetota bacterium]
MSSDEDEPFLRLDPPGRVVWITGLPGAGKSTIARHVHRALRAAGRPTAYLDGDAVRAACGADLGYDPDARLRNALRVARLCRMLALQGLDVVCATVSLFHAVHRWNRERLPGYVEVLVRARGETLRRRDQKGLYSGAAGGARVDVPGLDQAAELPTAPHLIVDNDDEGDAARAAGAVIELLRHEAAP